MGHAEGVDDGYGEDCLGAGTCWRRSPAKETGRPQQARASGRMLIPNGQVAVQQRPFGFTVYSLVSGASYSPRLPTPESFAAPDMPPGSLPGRHLIIELHDAAALDDAPFFERVLRQAAEDSRAQVLALHHHVFTPDGGVTAFAMLAESHISIHTWPAERYAALDIFMCGVCNPVACLPAVATGFRPKRMGVLDLARGLDAPDHAGRRSTTQLPA